MTPQQFLADLIRRLFAKTPNFFKIVQTIGLLATLVVKLPDILLQFGVHLPITAQPYNGLISVAGIVLALVSQLTVSDSSKIKDSIDRK